MKRKTNEEFIQDLNNKYHGLYTPLESYVNNRTNIKFKCNHCNNEFYMRPNMILVGQGCPRCARLKMGPRKTHEQFLTELHNIHNNKYELLEQYKGIKTKIKFKCNICNNEFMMQPAQLLNGTNCPKCAKNQAKQKLTFTEEQFREKLKSIHNDKYINIDPYINYQTKIKIHCNNCNNEWLITPANLLNGHGCPKCALNKQQINVSNNNEFKEKLKQIHQDNYLLLDEFIDLNTSIHIHCNICNNDFSILPLNILKPGIQCKHCKNNITINEKTDYITYYIKNKETNKPIYVGITNDLNKRFNQHFINPVDALYSLHNLDYQNLFEIIVVKDNITRSHALDIETKYIQDFINQGYQLYNQVKIMPMNKQRNIIEKEHNKNMKKVEIKCIETNEIFNSINAAIRKYNITYARLKNACIYGDSAGIDDKLNPLHWQFIPFEGYALKSINTNTVYVLEEYINNKWIPFYIGITKQLLSDRLFMHYTNNMKNPNGNPQLYEKLCSHGKEYYKRNIRIRALEKNIIDRHEALKKEANLITEYNKKYTLVNIQKNINNYNKSKKLTIEKHQSFTGSQNINSKSIICITTGNRFNAGIEAAKFINASPDSINRVCKKRLKLIKNLQFDYLNEEFRQKNNYQWFILLFKLNNKPYYISYEMGNESDITLSNILSWHKYLHLTDKQNLTLEILNMCKDKNELYNKMQDRLNEVKNMQLHNSTNELNIMLKKIQRL